MGYLEQIIQLTGLPENIIKQEIFSRAEKLGYSKNDLELDELRHVVADYMQDVLVQLKDEFKTAQ